MTLVFLDTETTHLNLRVRHAWDIAAIVRRPGQPDTEHQWFVDVRDLDVATADPAALDVGRFWSRHPQARWVENHHGIRLRDDTLSPPGPGAVREHVMLTDLAALLTGWDTIVAGSNPAFDQYTLERRTAQHHSLLRQGITLGWHYHPADIVERARGWLAAQGRIVPDRTDDVVWACGINPDGYARHTALGDCRLFRDLHDVVRRPALPPVPADPGRQVPATVDRDPR